MKNILNKNIDSLSAIFFILLLIAGLFFLFLSQFFNIEYEFALYDSATAFGLFSLLAILLRFPIKYITLTNQSVPVIIISSILVSALAAVIWLFSLEYILSSFISNYGDFFTATMPLRGFVAFLIIMIMLLLTYFLSYYKNYHKKIEQENLLNNLITEAELSTLKYQINPHFIFNALNSISSLTLTSPQKAQEMTINLSTFLRKTLASNNSKMIKISEEIENLNLYLNIEKIRFSERLNFNFDIEEKILGFRIPGMILQPLIENTIKHGVHENNETTVVKLTGGTKGNYIHFSISNNFDKESVSVKGEGIGLSNINRRLKLIYKRNDLITISKKDFIFKVDLMIPIEGNNE